MKLYTELTSIPEGIPHTFILIPFLGIYAEAATDPDAGRFNELKEKGNNYFQLTENPIEADYFVLPYGYSFDDKYNSGINTFLEKAKVNGKKTLLFYNADDDTKITHDNVIVFRTSANASTKNAYEYALPGWSKDFCNYFPNASVTPVKKESKPGISYCGYVDYEKDGIFTSIKNLFASNKKDNESFAKSIRGKACRRMKSNSSINSNFIIRNGFWASGINDKIAARKEYAANMINSMFAIVARGGGNFSYRLYEVLSCGRIPVFINTDCVLPFENEINWKKHCVWVELNELDAIDKILLNFYKNTSEDKLLAIQQSNRKLYEEYLSPLGFFKHLNELLIKKAL